jgi:uncharacterized protein YbjT (DUF2867 family)
LLATRGVTLRAMVRAASHASLVTPSATLVEANCDDPASLERALRGMSRAYLVTPLAPQTQA